jgi:Uma2 family endonuclease
MTEEDDRPRKKLATYQDVIDAPEHMIAEIVDDELYLSPLPALPHASAATALGALLKPGFEWGRSGPGGWLVLPKPESHFRRDVLVPDLAGWRRDRLPRLPNVAFMTLAPDWICELLSTSTTRLDRLKKLPVYAREGVSHVWLVEPLRRTLEVFRLESNRFTAVRQYHDEATARIEPFEDLEFEFSLLWPELEDE